MTTEIYAGKAAGKTMTEEGHQSVRFQWASLAKGKYPELAWLYAVPNGGLRHRVVASKLKAEGVRKGIQDLNLDVPRGHHHGLRIEMKSRCRAARVRPDQAEVHVFLRAQGYSVVACRGADEAISALKAYLGPTS